ncbi:hypothetical protein NVP1164O_27 [Vibrio phage 1.164.O._10N.261.51.A7]|nr:hypothetical protein NVP1164O_27 [Vibrio phage 1.164.O._10N.261.51.A7]
MIYLVSFKVPSDGNICGHKHVYMEKWADGNDTSKVMEIIGNVHNYNPDDIIITSVFKLPDQ